VALEFAIPEVPVPITGDVTLLERAIGNLVHNAVRYGESGGHVALILELEKDRMRLRVLDDGPGVPKAERARLTQRRFRGAQARTRQPAGSGLGLAIAREVAERHGWTMRFEHPEAGGLEVVLEGPLAAPRN
jgi:signal transduction histidine kinase